MELGVLVFDGLLELRRHEDHCPQRVPRDEHQVRKAHFVADQVWAAGTFQMVVEDAEDPFDFIGVAFLGAGKRFVMQLEGVRCVRSGEGRSGRLTWTIHERCP